MTMRCSVLASMLMVVGIVMLANLSGISAQRVCGADVQSLAKSCGRYIAKEGPQIPPSQDCCGVLKDADLPCLFKILTAYQSRVSMQKAAYVAKTCGLSVPTGFKSGSYTVPT